MIEITEVKKVLNNTKTIIEHHRKLTIAKGEHFNLFSVLGIETKENKTHSAFLSELLNPKGSHKMGDIFLKLFLKVIKHNEQFITQENRQFDTNNAFVKVERSVGPIDLKNKDDEDQSEATGGRIDIYLQDQNKNIISIENKIHADDQEAQIQRYCNHEPEKNTVYYLTLKGEDPSEYSRLKLNAGEDFFNLSYREEMMAWLELCLKEVPNFTGLRESINQYILLIKKLTHILSKEQQKPLNDIIVKHLEESQYIADNYQKVINTIRERFRKELKKRLEKQLNEELFVIKEGRPIHQNYAQLWIHYNNRKHIPFSFGIEPFSGNGNGNGTMFVGLYGYKGALCEKLPNPNRLNNVWQHHHKLKTAAENNLHLNSKNLLKTLYNSTSEDYEKLVSCVVGQIITFIGETNKHILPTEDATTIEKVKKED